MALSWVFWVLSALIRHFTVTICNCRWKGSDLLKNRFFPQGTHQYYLGWKTAGNKDHSPIKASVVLALRPWSQVINIIIKENTTFKRNFKVFPPKMPQENLRMGQMWLWSLAVQQNQHKSRGHLTGRPQQCGMCLSFPKSTHMTGRWRTFQYSLLCTVFVFPHVKGKAAHSY